MKTPPIGSAVLTLRSFLLIILTAPMDTLLERELRVHSKRSQLRTKDNSFLWFWTLGSLLQKTTSRIVSLVRGNLCHRLMDYSLVLFLTAHRKVTCRKWKAPLPFHISRFSSRRLFILLDLRCSRIASLFGERDAQPLVMRIYFTVLQWRCRYQILWSRAQYMKRVLEPMKE